MSKYKLKYSVFKFRLKSINSYRLLKTPEEVLKAGKYMVACQISREPLIRKCLRETFFDRAKLNIVPSKRGIKEMDENHNCYSLVCFLISNNKIYLF